MRRFEFGEKVFIEVGCKREGKIIDTRYLGVFKQYAVSSVYEVRGSGIDGPVENVGWFSPWSIVKNYELT